MNDNLIPISRIVTVSLWIATLLLCIAAWIAWWLAGPGEDAWMMLGFSTCAMSGVAATAQVRCYTLRVVALLRAVGGLERSDGTDLRLMR